MPTAQSVFTFLQYAAQQVEAALAQGQTPPGSDVSVTTGSDFTVNQPPAPSPPPVAGPSTSPAPPTTTTTAPSSTSSGSSQLGAPTPATTPLAPFDPRSCTPSGGPGP